MDLTAINDNIEELENDDTSVENVKELALLYIVRDNLNKSVKSTGNGVEKEYTDILPQYHKYIEIKRAYQLGNIDEKAVETALKRVCKEIHEFIQTIYSCTDMPKERRLIIDMIENLQTIM